MISYKKFVNVDVFTYRSFALFSLSFVHNPGLSLLLSLLRYYFFNDGDRLLSCLLGSGSLRNCSRSFFLWCCYFWLGGFSFGSRFRSCFSSGLRSSLWSSLSCNYWFNRSAFDGRDGYSLSNRRSDGFYSGFSGRRLSDCGLFFSDCWGLSIRFLPDRQRFRSLLRLFSHNLSIF
jgi:hypothetical protein